MRALFFGALVTLWATATFACDRVLVSTKPMDIQIRTLVQQVSDINEYYLSAPEAGGTYEERIRGRNAKVRDFFKTVTRDREATHGAYRCLMEKTQTCTSSTGNTKRCPAEKRVDAGDYFLPTTVETEGGGFKTEGRGSQKIVWFDLGHRKFMFVIGKSGRGKNRGTVRVQSQHLSTEVTKLTQADLGLLRAALAKQGLPDDTTPDP